MMVTMMMMSLGQRRRMLVLSDDGRRVGSGARGRVMIMLRLMRETMVHRMNGCLLTTRMVMMMMLLLVM